MKVGDLIRVKPHVHVDDGRFGGIGLIVQIVDAEALWSSDDYASCIKALVGEQVYPFRKSEIEVYESR